MTVHLFCLEFLGRQCELPPNRHPSLCLDKRRTCAGVWRRIRAHVFSHGPFDALRAAAQEHNQPQPHHVGTLARVALSLVCATLGEKVVTKSTQARLPPRPTHIRRMLKTDVPSRILCHLDQQRSTPPHPLSAALFE